MRGDIHAEGESTVVCILKRENGLVEYVCKHGIGHPSKDLTPEKYYYPIHGCDGCCAADTFKPSKQQLKDFRRR